ncbi:MAG TPA: MFS transporter [Beijerinckiaceae bacterium]|nr:MFS transporter [Beijerinckiaceae bacterium]
MPSTAAHAPFNRVTWVAIGGLGITQIIGWGSTYYLLTLLGRPIATELGLSQAFVSAGLSLMLIMGAVFGPVAGRAMDQRGARPVMALGSLIASAGLVALAFVRGPVGYMAAWFVIGLSAALILYPAAFTALTQIAPHQARRAISWLTLPGGLASTVFWPLTEALLTIMDWRSICLFYAALNLCVCLPLHLAVIRRDPAAADQQDESGPLPQGLPADARRMAFLLFAAALALNSLLVTGLLNHFIAIMRDFGQPAQAAVAIGMVFGLSQTSARILELISGARTDPLMLGVAVAAGFPLAFAAMMVAPASLVAGMAFAVILGMCNGLWTIVRGAMVLRLFGVAGYGENLGTIIVAQGLAAGVAPILLASLMEIAGVYAAFVACGLVSATALVAMVLLFRHARRVEAAARPGP